MNRYFQDVRPGAASTTARIFVPATPAARSGVWGFTGEVPPAPPGGYLPPTDWKPRSHKPPKRGVSAWVSILIGVIGLLLLASCVGVVAGAGGSSSPEPTTAPATVPSVVDTKAAKVGDKVRIEDLQYQVHATRCGIKHVGLKDFGRSAQGSFCRIDLSVTNVGKEPQFWDATLNVKAEDTSGRKFGVDGSAGIFGNKSESGWTSEINPGNTVRAYVFFDLPRAAKLKELELSSGFLGDDVEIKV